MATHKHHARHNGRLMNMPPMILNSIGGILYRLTFM